MEPGLFQRRQKVTKGPLYSSGKLGRGDRLQRRSIQRFLRRYAHVNGFCVLWLLVLYYGERLYPRGVIGRCKWHNKFKSASRVALIADPQLVDDHTYPGRPRVLLSITKYIVDIYLRKNWVYIQKMLDPDANFFLGDLFDGGRGWARKEWLEEFVRFNGIFDRPPNKRTVMSLPGNHDIGYGDEVVPEALARFEAFFGPGSSDYTIGNYTIVLLDAISMANTKNPQIYGPPREYLESFDPKDQNQILLSHVPLYRPKGHDCGKHRESKKPLPYVHGHQYQTLLNPDISNQILQAVQPLAVFSGDDHDACHVEHEYYSKFGAKMEADEYTVKSISMAMGIERPGIQLLTLDNSVPGYQTSICLMPSPFYPILVYSFWLVVTVGCLGVWNMFPDLIPRRFRLRWLRIIGDSERMVYSLPVHRKSHASAYWYEEVNGVRQFAIECAIVAVLALSWFLYLVHSIFH
ncbi:cell division control protein 1 [Trichomonascus vanleenenianus]|uniref:cell division control protein 1 n=1 Tax=Trichomonascus vanleenenianus TaxID=2268995 RepID=UPI003EC9E738